MLKLCFVKRISGVVSVLRTGSWSKIILLQGVQKTVCDLIKINVRLSQREKEM